MTVESIEGDDIVACACEQHLMRSQSRLRQGFRASLSSRSTQPMPNCGIASRGADRPAKPSAFRIRRTERPGREGAPHPRVRQGSGRHVHPPSQGANATGFVISASGAPRARHSSLVISSRSRAFDLKPVATETVEVAEDQAKSQRDVALRGHHELLLSAIEAAAIPMLVVDANGDVIAASRPARPRQAHG
jgi:hypothetical protein